MLALAMLAAALAALPANSSRIHADSTRTRPDSLRAHADSAQARPDTTAFTGLQTYLLKEIVVTATRTPLPLLLAPASVTVVAPDSVAPGASTRSRLARIAGASFGATGGPGSAMSLHLRGASGENLLVLLDGVPLNSSLMGGYDLNKLSGTISSIEVLRGPASSLYGANAVAGVVNITTDEPQYERPYSCITYEKGNFGTQQLKAKFSRGLSRKLSMWLGADWNTTGGQRTNSAYDGTNYSIGASAGPFRGLTAKVYLQDYTADAGVPGPAGYETPSTRQRDKQQDASLRLAHHLVTGDRRYDGHLAVARSTIKNSYGDSLVTTDNDSRQTSLDGQYTVTAWPGLSITAGGNYLLADCHSGNSGDHTLHQRSLFTAAQYDGITNLLLDAGARYDKNYWFDHQVSPTLSASLLLDGPRLVAYASYGRAFRAPTVNELFWRDDLFMMYGDRNLRPERSWQAETGIKAGRGAMAFVGSLFLRKTRDLIQWQPMPDYSYRTVNIGRVKTAGLEASLTAGLLPWLKADLNYTYCRTTQDDSTGRLLLYHPLNVANGSLTVNDLKLVENLWLGWLFTASYTDCQNPGPYAATIPRTVICGQTLSLKLRAARLYYRLDNLFNADYVTRYLMQYPYPMPRRGYVFGISMELWN